MESKCQVKVLIEGYSHMTEDGNNRATGSSTLIKGPVNVIVDTGGPWDTERLLRQLHLSGMTPERIAYVVVTHGHSDHVGNLNLFKNARHVVGFDINEKDLYFDHDFKSGKSYSIYEDLIEVIPTPGHMHSDVSVVARNVVDLGTVVMCGDLFESEHDDDVWRELSEWPDQQLKNRQRVLEIADYIIPGHGPMFKVKR